MDDQFDCSYMMSAVSVFNSSVELGGRFPCGATPPFVFVLNECVSVFDRNTNTAITATSIDLENRWKRKGQKKSKYGRNE